MAKNIFNSIDELFIKPVVNAWKQSSKKVKDEDIIPILSFQKFTLTNFKGIDKIEIDLVKNDLVLLLGLNESGKSTILKGIEAFSFLNDPAKESNPEFFRSIRRKADVGGSDSTIITAKIKIEDKIYLPPDGKVGNIILSETDRAGIDAFLKEVTNDGMVEISRVFPFKNGKPDRYYYKFESDHPFASTMLSRHLATEVVNVCPFILYFEDFKDRIPERIYVEKSRKDSFDYIWYDIIDGLFYNTDENFSIEKFKKLYIGGNQQFDDANTVITRVNKKLNKTFTNKWKDLSGVKEIEKSELKYVHNSRPQYFTLKILDEDGTTYSVDERSKGALWYLSFLMKTEFRSKKLRKRSGKPVFLIDEPASNLHSTAQQNMINDFRALAQDTSVIYTTHSQYLVSLENVRNTLIIEKVNGVVSAQKWGVYLNRQDAQPSYYQPILNLLNIIPHSLDIPWKNCVITEGPSDRHVLLSLFRILFNADPKFVIYPGTSASTLSPLISLNFAWNANFKVLLDSDDAGTEAAKKYSEMFGLDDEIVHIPTDKKLIEKCFTKDEKESIRNTVFPENAGKKVSKKEFAAMWAVVSEDPQHDKAIDKMLTPATRKLFENLFKQLQSNDPK